MTHDELLDKIYWSWRHQDTEYFGLSGYRNALREVMELHKPDKYGFCYCSDIPGKCPTKKTIERELA